MVKKTMREQGLFLGLKLDQTKDAIGVWEIVLRKFPFQRIVEIGTYRGNTSIFFLLYCMRVGAKFLTYDIKDMRRIKGEFIRKLYKESDCFRLGDVFKKEQEIKEFITQEGLSIVFCDGGNKEKEFNLFSQHLKLGDIIAVHDWGTEVKKENLKLNNFKDLGFTDGMTRFFRKRK